MGNIKNMKFRYFFIAALLSVLCIKIPDRFCDMTLATGVEGQFPEFTLPNFREIVARPLRFIGHGRQAAAFTTADGNYVIKFFFTRRPHTDWSWGIPSIKKLWPPAVRAKKKLFADKNKRRTRKAIESYRWAYENFREETGLVAVHLGKTQIGLGRCTLVDEEGKRYDVDLDDASFIVQKMCTPMDEMKVSAGALTRSVEQLLEKKARLGFTDRDNSFHSRHYGFIDGQAIMLDPGNIVFSEAVFSDPESEFIKTKSWFRHWQQQ